MPKEIIIDKIISGGQSGVDRSALDFAIRNNIPHGGWCPKNRWAEDGRISNIYHLTETKEESPNIRTKKNVQDADGSLIIFDKVKDKGTNKTIECCQRYHKSFMEIDLSLTTEKKDIIRWLEINKIKILNIAGSRESTNPGIYQKSLVFLEYLFRQ